MMSWRNVAWLAVLASGVGVACTVTTDGDGTGGTGSITGGSTSTGGTAAAGRGSTGGTSSGGATANGGGGGSDPFADDQACFTCLNTNCSSAWATCMADCEGQLHEFRDCVEARQTAQPPEAWGEAQQTACIAEVADNDIGANLAVGVNETISCAIDITATPPAPCEATCFDFTP